LPFLFSGKRINKVTLRQAGLVLRWVTVLWYTVFIFNQATQATLEWQSARPWWHQQQVYVTADISHESLSLYSLWFMLFLVGAAFKQSPSH